MGELGRHHGWGREGEKGILPKNAEFYVHYCKLPGIGFPHFVYGLTNGGGPEQKSRNGNTI